MSGRQQGMCRRTEDLQLKGQRDGQGRGMGGRCRGNFFQKPLSQSQQQDTQKGFGGLGDKDLKTLVSEYQKAQVTIDSLMDKIKELERKIYEDSSHKAGDEG